MKRRKVTTFSLSFLDCICCGLGAVILLFVLVNAKSAARRDAITSDLRAEVDRMERQMLEGEKKMVEYYTAAIKGAKSLNMSMHVPVDLLDDLQPEFDSILNNVTVK